MAEAIQNNSKDLLSDGNSKIDDEVIVKVEYYFDYLDADGYN